MTPRDQQEIWSAFLLVLICVFGSVVMTQQCGCASTPPSPEDALHTANHATTLERCKGEGREAGSYAVYYGCTVDAGLR